MEEHRQLIQTIKTDASPVYRKIAALDKLISADDKISSLGVCHACFVRNAKVMKYSCKAIMEFSYSRFSDLIDFILEEEAEDTRYERKKFLDLLHKLRRRDMLRYIVENAVSLSDDGKKRWIMGSWLRQSQATNELIKALFKMPTPAAKNFVKLLARIDNSVIFDIIKIVRGYIDKPSASDLVLKGLAILEDVASRNDIVLLLIKLLGNDTPKVRSKVTLMLSKLLDKFSFIRDALKDDDARVRANALEAIWGEDTPEAKGLFASCLDDENNRVRANAAKGLHEISDERGLKTLMEMLNDEDKMMRASAAWALGEIRAASMTGALVNLQENDPEDIVQKNAQIALEKISQLKNEE